MAAQESEEGLDRRDATIPCDSSSSDLPLEVAFLQGQVAQAQLQAVARRARAVGVAADLVLLADGLLTVERYYRQLAFHLNLPFVEDPMRPAAGAVLEDVLQTGILPLAPNMRRWRYLVAPRGPALRAILDRADLVRASPDSTVAVTSPERLEALVRQAQRRTVARSASHALPDWNERLSARDGLTARQATVALIALALASGLAARSPALLLDAVMALFAVGFLLAVSLRLAATATSPSSLRDPLSECITDRDLPVYSVIIPLYREAREVGRLVAAIERIDYPRAKLDVLVMVEADDRATLAALDRAALPACFRVIVAPTGQPQTKPRALNVGLQFARGERLVVFDAEDDPDPAQLRAAAARFVAEPDIACLQAKLAIDNSADSWLTRLFALEYAALFHVVNPGLAELRLPIPLGGTSNHFRTDVLRRLNGWDAWNVTEDIDLGLRLARFGHRVATLDSVTFEEAPLRLRAWLAQRSRWHKGWMVTLATHSRDPLTTWRELGFWGGLATWAMLFGTIASSLFGPFCATAVALHVWSGELLAPKTPGAAAWSAISCFLVTTGVASALWPAVLGARRRGAPGLLAWLPLLPFYLLLMSLAAWQAAFEVAGRPYAWTKTEHGKAKRRTRFA